MSVGIRKIEVDTSELRKRFTSMARRSEDFSDVFDWALRQLAVEHAKLFAANGNALGSRPWQPLRESTVSWKIANGYGSNGILVREGTLKDSLTNLNSGRGAVREIDKKTASFGTEVEYARYHFYGTRNMPSRKPLFVPEHFAWRTATATGKHIVYGNIPQGLDLILP